MTQENGFLPAPFYDTGKNGFGLQERDAFFDSKIGTGHARASSPLAKQTIFIVACGSILLSMWTPRITDVVWELVASFPVFLAIAAVAAAYIVPALGPKEKMKPDDPRNRDLTTKQRRLFGLKPDPRSVLADKKQMQALKKERYGLAAASSSAFTPDGLASTDYMQLTSADLYAPKPQAPAYVPVTPISSQLTSYSSFRNCASPDRLDALRNSAATNGAEAGYPAGVGVSPAFGELPEGDEGALFAPDFTAREVYQYASCMAQSTHTTAVLSKNGLPAKPTKDLLTQFSFKAQRIERKLRIAGEMNAWANNMKRWFVEVLFIPILRDFDKSDRFFEAIADKYKRDRTLNSSQQRIVHNLPKFRAFIMRTKPMEKIVRKRMQLDRYLEVGNAPKEYVLGRLRKIGRSLSTNAYKWDKGGESWTNALPTDARIVMHVFLTWIQDIIPAFNTYCLISAGSRERERDSKFPAIKECYRTPPYYCVYLPGANNTSKLLMVQPGRENVFKTLALFFYLIKKQHNGMLLNIELTSGSLRGLSNVLAISQFAYYY